MGLTFNGSTPETITYNGNDVLKVTYDGVTVWEKVTTKTYRYKAKACRYGNTSLQIPTTDGLFTLNSSYPSVMFCFQDTLDVTGYNTKLSDCMNKSISSMVMYFYRANTYAYSASTNTCWTYNQQISNGGMTAITNRHATYHIDQAPPNPTAVGVQNSGLSTAQLKNIFASSCRYLLSTASGSGCNALTANNYYYTFGFRCKWPPSGSPQLRCDNINYNDVYIDIVATG